MIPRPKHNRFIWSRRNFILALLFTPLVTSELMADKKNDEDFSLSSSREDEFVIVGGWVLLKTDLMGSLS